MPAASTTLRPAARPRAREHGFTLVEMLVALGIVAILMAVVVPRFMGAKTNVYGKEARTAGAAYAQAISLYQGDNHNKNPTAWPTTGAAAQKGPLNLLGKPYLPAIPDAISGGKVGLDVGTNCGATGVAAGGSFYGQVSICLGTAPSYGVRVATRSDLSSQDWKICWYGRTSSAPAC